MFNLFQLLTHPMINSFQIQPKIYNDDYTSASNKILQQVGMSWDSFEDVWKRRYCELYEYKRENSGCTNIPRKYKDNPSLGLWCQSQLWL